MVKKLNTIMDVLKPFNPEISKWYTIKQVVDGINLSYEPVYTYLKRLSNDDILRHKRDSNVHFYSLNLRNSLTVKGLERIELERRNSLFGRLNSKVKSALDDVLREIEDNLVCALLFGEYAVKKVKKGDIDVLFVVSGKSDEKIIGACSRLGARYGVHIFPVIVYLSEFRRMLNERNEFTEKLLKEKVVLFGLEFYFRELVRSMERLKWI